MGDRGASNDDSDRELAFYTPGAGLLDADWLELAASDDITSCCRCKSAAAMERSSWINSLQYKYELSIPYVNKKKLD